MEDDVDYSPRGEVVRRVARIKYDIARGPKALDAFFKEIDPAKLSELISTDRELRGRENASRAQQELSEAFEYLDRHFIAPLAANDPELANDGYRALNALMASSWAAGCYLNDVLGKKIARRFQGRRSGKKSGERRKKKQAEWADEALPVAKKYVEIYSRYSQDDLASYIEHMIDPPVQHAQIKAVISGWQKDGSLAKKRVKRASPAK